MDFLKLLNQYILRDNDGAIPLMHPPFVVQMKHCKPQEWLQFPTFLACFPGESQLYS